MESNWALEHLQVIRTLMERSAVYRRALAPIMTFLGALGAVAAVVGYLAGIDTPRNFIAFWGVVSLLGLGGSFFLVRRQALKASEPFWSPPTRRITQAFLPPLAAGLFFGLLGFVAAPSAPGQVGNVTAMLWLPLLWVVLYGCAFHAAGFFMPRGMRLFGWSLILGGCAGFLVGIPDWPPRGLMAHGIMGFFFGLLQLAYGIYLYFTEKSRNET